jgi:hypothetical protein
MRRIDEATRSAPRRASSTPRAASARTTRPLAQVQALDVVANARSATSARRIPPTVLATALDPTPPPPAKVQEGAAGR